MRPSGRAPDELRSVSLERKVSKHAEGSCLVKFGDTHVLCTASIDERAPIWLRDKRQGWVTAEYGMLPRATNTRTAREAAIGKQSGRTLEIQRLIGRSLRAVTDMTLFGERQIRIDCDVLQADGGTRTASITGAYIALHDCFATMRGKGLIEAMPLFEPVAAISAGVFGGAPVLDLDYAEDSAAEADGNFVFTASGGIVEIQTTAEDKAIPEAAFLDLLALAKTGVARLVDLQKQALAGGGG